MQGTKPRRRPPSRMSERELAAHAIGQVALLRAMAAIGDPGDAAQVRKCSRAMDRLCVLAQASERFGVVMPVVAFGEFARSFWRWLNWWSGPAPRVGHWSEAPDKKAFTAVMVELPKDSG